MLQTHTHKAMAMIELIFSIVIMGIVLMSAPLLISTATKSSFLASQQESIAATAAEIGMVLTHHWDEANTDLNNTAPVLLAAGDTDLDAVGTTGRRAGTPIESARTFLTSLGGGPFSASAALTADTGDRDDIDDFNGLSTTLTSLSATTTSDGDYLDKNITLLTTVTYIDDTPTGTTNYVGGGSSIIFNNPFNRTAIGVGVTSNIKLVTVRLTTTNTVAELDKNIILNAFSCNIGTYELNQVSFP